jgi:hypothetical protein
MCPFQLQHTMVNRVTVLRVQVLVFNGDNSAEEGDSEAVRKN